MNDVINKNALNLKILENFWTKLQGMRKTI